MLEIEIIVYDGVDDLDYCGPLEVLRHAENFGSQASVNLVTFNGQKKICTSTNTVIEVNKTLGNPDGIIVPGGGWVDPGPGLKDIVKNVEYLTKISDIYQTSKFVSSICSGAMLLGAAGLLKGKKATTNSRVINDLKQFDAIPIGSSIVRSGKIATCGGPINSVPFSLYLIEQFFPDCDVEKLAESLDFRADYASSRFFSSERVLVFD